VRMSARQLPEGAVPSAVARSPVIASVIVSADGQLVTANDTFRRFLGYESLDELCARDFKTELLRHASDWTAWQRTSEDGGKIEVTFVSETGEDVLLRGHV
jgi:PAS domain-containing protein